MRCGGSGAKLSARKIKLNEVTDRRPVNAGDEHARGYRASVCCRIPFCYLSSSLKRLSMGYYHSVITTQIRVSRKARRLKANERECKSLRRHWGGGLFIGYFGNSCMCLVVRKVRTQFKAALGWVATWSSTGLRWVLRARQGIPGC